MLNYRLKEQAVPFINEKHATSIYSLDIWKSLGIDINALEEVEPIYLTYGHINSRGSGNLCGWDEKGAKFHFTVNFPSLKHCEYDKFSSGRMTRALMDKIQRQIDNYFEDFINQSDDK